MIDSHCHLDWNDFQKDFSEVLIRAKQAGVVQLNHIVLLPDGLEKGVELANKHDEIFLSAGCHPQEASKWTESIAEMLRELNNFNKFIAVGEIGLDYFRDYSPIETQHEVLRKQLRIARELDKPIIIHCRDKIGQFKAYDDLYDILLDVLGDNVNGVMHCFSGNLQNVNRFTELGMYISYAGHLTYKKNNELRETVKTIPRNKILIETDAPFLAPQSKRGKRNEPSLITEVLTLIAELININFDEINKITEENTRNLFHIPKIN
ncbi:MAG: TatD family hydrolase [Planctomycetes bacterium]|nr:TatD family hydrolase [Planctomycetota bacterium]